MWRRLNRGCARPALRLWINIAAVIAFFFAGNAGAAVLQTDTVCLSLDSCISIALSDNPLIKVADMEIKRMDYSKREVLGQLLPSVSFNGQYSRTLDKQTMYMNMSRGGTPDSESAGSEAGNEGATPGASASGGGIKVGLDNSYTLGFQASMPLIAPQLWKSLKLNDDQILEKAETARRSRLETVNGVKNAYYALLLSLDSYKAIGENYEMAKFTAALYRKQFELGAASEFDVLRTEVAVKNVEPQLTQAVIAVRQARLQLAILMGMDSRVAVKPDVTLAAYERDMYGKALNAGAASENISGNADLRLLDVQTQQLRHALDVQKMSLLPTLSVSTNYNWSSMSNGTPFKHFRWTPNSQVALTLSVPLFEGMQRYNRIRQAKVQVAEMDWQRANLVRNINMQVELAKENIKLNIGQITSSAESMRQAQRAYDIMRESFKIGAASYLDFRDSELALTQSRLAYYQSIYNYLVADSNLELLLGNAPVDRK